MSRRARAGALLVVVAAGCGGSPPASSPPIKEPPPPPDARVQDVERVACTAAIGKAGSTGRDGEEPDDHARAAEQAMIESCVATGWAPDVLTCMSTGTTKAELRACPDLLTKPQLEELLERLIDAGLMQRQGAPPP